LAAKGGASPDPPGDQPERPGRDFLAGGGATAVLAAAGYNFNFALLLRWFGKLLRALLQACSRRGCDPNSSKNRRQTVLHGRPRTGHDARRTCGKDSERQI